MIFEENEGLTAEQIEERYTDRLRKMAHERDSLAEEAEAAEKEAAEKIEKIKALGAKVHDLGMKLHEAKGERDLMEMRFKTQLSQANMWKARFETLNGLCKDFVTNLLDRRG